MNWVRELAISGPVVEVDQVEVDQQPSHVGMRGTGR
jgi:hypothetical protein